jgi:DNA-binding response OmpR family regulator
MSVLIVLVNADPRARQHAEAMLSELGYLVAALPSVIDAKKAIDLVTPDLVIADLHLDAYNGLELALRSRVAHPDVPVIVTHTSEDAVAEAAAAYYGATFIAAPLENPRFLPSVRAAIERRRRAQVPIRRWSRKPTVGVVDVIAADGPAQIIDVSYGGVRLAFSQPQSVIIPETFTIALQADVLVQARRVWTARAPSDEQVRCGAELSVAAEEPWRHFVKSLSESPAA